MGSQRPGGLRRAADAIFALVSLLPLILVVVFTWHFGRLDDTMAPVGILLAVVIALLGFVIFRQMVDRITDQITGLGQVAQGQVPDTLPATGDKAAVVPGLGRVAEIGEIAQAFSG